MGFADKIRALFRKSNLDDSVYEDLADLLVEGDFGATFAYEIVDSLKAACARDRISDVDAARSKLKDLLGVYAHQAELALDKQKLNIILLLGVNGVGKTTSCAKLARWASTRTSGEIILSAGDTFRAAAVNQLKIHGERLGLRVVAQGQGADTGAVLWDAIEAAKLKSGSLVIGDTAGRMHTRQDLLRELEKLSKIVAQRAPEASFRRILVLDSTTGQNGLRQAESFSQAVKLDGVILTKYDSSAKGGMILALQKQFGLDTLFLGTGEGYGDFEAFDPRRFLSDFVGA